MKSTCCLTSCWTCMYKGSKFCAVSCLLLAGCDVRRDIMAAQPAAPEKHILANQWDSNPFVRDQMRQHHKLLSWISPQQTGVANRATLKKNVHAIRCALACWVDHCDCPKSPPISWLREEVFQQHHIGCFRIWRYPNIDPTILQSILEGPQR